MQFSFSFSLPRLGRLVSRTVSRSVDALDRQLSKGHDATTRFLVTHPGISRTIALNDKCHSVAWLHDKALIEQVRRELGLPIPADDSVEG